MPFFVVHGDITKMEVDAIVNAANSTLLGGGGVDGAIHYAAGPKLLQECKTLGGCATGQAKITNGYNLPAKYVIHTVGPVYHNGKCGEKDALTACYFNSLKIAKEHNLQSIAFPVISSGVYGYPMDEAIEVAKNTIVDFLGDYDISAYLVLYDRKQNLLSHAESSDVERYIRDKQREYINYDRYDRDDRYNSYSREMCCEAIPPRRKAMAVDSDIRFSIADISEVDESFSELLLKLIDEKGYSDVEFYKKANISRKVFSKAKDVNYQPSKLTAVAFGLALELDKHEFGKFLKKAGFALSDHIKFDVIIEYCIERKIYNIFKVNEILLDFDQSLIGQ